MTEVVDRPTGKGPAAGISAARQQPAVQPAVDVAALGEQLLGKWAAARRQARSLASKPELHKIEGLTHTDHRVRAFGQLKYLVDNNGVHRAFPVELGGADDHGGNVAGFEELVTADPSLQIKAGVQWGLFGSAVMHLGTAEHHAKWLPGIMSLEVPGCFAMTETGHGSDVASIATTATFDPDTQEFVIHTPFRAAWKDYIGNAAIDGLSAVVFAQLVTKDVNHGVHAFYVELRDRRPSSSCRESAVRMTVSRGASTASTTAACTSTTSASPGQTCSTATATWEPTVPTHPPSPAPAGGSSPCWERSSRAACHWTARQWQHRRSP
jgi:acyl-CoA oxidase